MKTTPLAAIAFQRYKRSRTGSDPKELRTFLELPLGEKRRMPTNQRAELGDTDRDREEGVGKRDAYILAGTNVATCTC